MREKKVIINYISLLKSYPLSTGPIAKVGLS